MLLLSMHLEKSTSSLAVFSRLIGVSSSSSGASLTCFHDATCSKTAINGLIFFYLTVDGYDLSDCTIGSVSALSLSD